MRFPLAETPSASPLEKEEMETPFLILPLKGERIVETPPLSSPERGGKKIQTPLRGEESERGGKGRKK